MKLNKIIILLIICIVLISFGCSTFFLSPKNIEIRRNLTLADKLSEQGEYEQAIKENERVLKKNPENPWQDEVLFNLGYLYAYYDNPQKDYHKSMIYFKRLITEFPLSSFRKEGNVWLVILSEILSKEETINSLREEINSLENGIIDIQSSMSLEILLKEQKIETLEEIIHSQELSIDLLQAQIKKFKEVDIELEKREKEVKEESSDNQDSQ